MKKVYKPHRFRDEALERIEECNAVIEQYQADGYRLTLRQLYYQLVSKNVIPNTPRSYKVLGNLVSDARLAGMMDWDAIEDRGRVPRAPSEFEDLQELAEAAVASYRLPRWAGQQNYVELWVEKDALSGVLWPVAKKHHITLMVNRGYSSQSAMREAALRFINNERDDEGVLLYLGDHDPSGEDMVRDIADRLDMFQANVRVEKIALTMDQVEEYEPPPNPAKMSDSRAESYVAQHGHESWEVDALPPNVLVELIEEKLVELIDQDLLDEVLEREERDKKNLLEAVKKLRRKK